MRARFVCVAALACVARGAGAQTWDVGALAGVSHADVIGSQEFDWTGNVPTSAIMVRRHLSRFFAVQAEVADLRRFGVSNVVSSTLTMSADYLELPVMLQLHSRPLSIATAYVAGGPGFSFRLQCRFQFLGGGLRTNDDCDSARGAKTNRVDVGAVSGAGVNVHLGVTTLAVEARSTFGLLTNILPIDAQNARGFSWTLLAGVSVPVNLRRSIPAARAPTLAALPAPLEILGNPRIEREQSRVAPLTTTTTVRRVSINAVDADVRRLITGIAETAGLNVVVSSDVNARVSVTLADVPAMEAIRAITDVAGLTILPSSTEPSAATVYYQTPVNVNEASADTIARRFDVSPDLAKWLVETRIPKPRTP